jgi:TRAP-type uncharacterized transport system substrate-binding protein
MRIALVLMACLLALPAMAAPKNKTMAAAEPKAVQKAVAPKSQKPKAPSPREALRATANQTVVTVMAGGSSSTDLAIASDLSEILDDQEHLRVLPIVGKGAIQSVKDVMFLRGVDMGITQANVLKHFAATGELGPNFVNEIVYVAKLFNEEIHVVARSEIADIGALKGRKVNLGIEGSGGAITGRLLFEALGIPIEPLHLPDNEALAKVKAGEIDAAIVIAGKPAPAAASLRRADGLKLLSVPYPKEIEDSYYPANLTHDDYPELIAEGESVDTVSVCAVLISFNWPRGSARYRRVASFVDAFFGKFDEFLASPHHPKWREVNFAATLEGWHRSPAAQDWIDRTRVATEGASRTSFDTFLAEAGKNDGAAVSADDRAALFRAFLQWSKERSGE